MLNKEFPHLNLFNSRNLIHYINEKERVAAKRASALGKAWKYAQDGNSRYAQCWQEHHLQPPLKTACSCGELSLLHY